MAPLKLLRRRLEPGATWYGRRLPGREAAWQEAVSQDMWRYRWSLRYNGQLWKGQVASAALDGRWRDLDPCWLLVTMLTPDHLEAALDALAADRNALLLDVLRAQGHRV